MLLCIFQRGAGSARGVAQRAVTVKSETAKNCCRIFMTVHVRTRTWDRGHTGLLQGCPSSPHVSFPPTYSTSHHQHHHHHHRRCCQQSVAPWLFAWRTVAPDVNVSLAGVELDTQLPRLSPLAPRPLTCSCS